MNEPVKRTQRVKKIITTFVFVSLLASTVFIIVRMILAPVHTGTEEFGKLKSDYVLMLLQCVVGLFALTLPGMLTRRAQIVLPDNMIVLYVVFLYCAIYLGEVRSFYYAIPHWDTMLHTFSGAMLGALGFSVVHLLNDNTKNVHLSPLFVALFAFCFAVTLGVVWEIYEYSADAMLRTNMQKFALENGTPLVGRAALNDTMKDLIVDAAGALVISGTGYFSLKRNPAWLGKFEIRKAEDAEVSQS